MSDGPSRSQRRQSQQLKIEPVYNPLDKLNLGVSVSDALLARAVLPLPPERFGGAGIYALYYVGDFLPYAPIAARNRNDQYSAPIYVGKAVPAGARKDGLAEGPVGTALYKRLNEHAKNIAAVANLSLADFRCRYLVVDDIWIPLGEELMIRRFQPIWNKVVDGFGIHDPGSRRPQNRSQWDTLHPGRSYARNRPPNEMTLAEIVNNLSRFLTGLPAAVIDDNEAGEEEADGSEP